MKLHCERCLKFRAMKPYDYRLCYQCVQNKVKRIRR